MSENGIRINKYLSEAGVCSRREADRLVDAGRVCIDGVTAVSGAKVCDGQTVTLDGRNIKKEDEEIYLAFFDFTGNSRGSSCKANSFAGMRSSRRRNEARF